MNTQERIKMVKAMEYIARRINDYDVFEGWLISGVADGDINYDDLTVEDDGIEDYYTEDTDFADLMDTFLRCMTRAYKFGGLYCDNVVSNAQYRYF